MRAARACPARPACERLGLSVWELPPGEAGYPYHYHLTEEEMLIVLEGRPSLRTPGGWRDLAEGELVGLPRGEAGAHQLVNRSDALVRFLAFSTSGEPDVVIYPDSAKLGAYRAPPGGRRRAGALPTGRRRRLLRRRASAGELVPAALQLRADAFARHHRLRAGLPPLPACAALYVASIAVLLASHLGHGWGFVDLVIYRDGGEAVLAGAHLYDLRFPGALAFTYPPLAALLFTGLTVPSIAVLRALVTGANLLPAAADARLRAAPVSR